MIPQSSYSFANILSPSSLRALEEHDDILADICQSNLDMASTSGDSSTTALTNITSLDTSTSSIVVVPIDRNKLKIVRHMGSGTYCRVDMVAHESNRTEVLAHKSIDPSRVKCSYDLSVAATELVNEAKILSNLDHENIIKLRGLSSERFSESFASGSDGYFLVMDILNETLSDRLLRWRKESELPRRSGKVLKRTQEHFSNRFRKVSCTKIQDCQRLYDRIEVTVLGIAKGMKYLHSKNIVLRDLKPDNIGYENNSYENSTVKLFDFGMAMAVEDCEPEELAGSPRYMSPEVMARKEYTLAIDVYSFGVVLYEICSLKLPYEKSYRKRCKSKTARRHKQNTRTQTLQDFYSAVIHDQIKPSYDLKKDVCCFKLRALIEACWDQDPSKRPTFDTILERLREILVPDLLVESKDNNSDLQSIQTRDCTERQSISIDFDRSSELCNSLPLRGLFNKEMKC